MLVDMRKRLPEGTFDTAKAKMICSWSTRTGGSEEETQYFALYKTVRGKFFIHVRGGENTPLARREHVRGKSIAKLGGGEDIYGVDEKEARELADKHASVDVWRATFPNNASKRSNLTLSETAWATLDRACRKQHKNRSELVEQLILDNLPRVYK